MEQDGSEANLVVEQVDWDIESGGLIRPGESVVVGVSGGADSVVLLDVLERLSRMHGWTGAMTVAHLDHGLRSNSQEDARFVAELASSKGLEFESDRCDVCRIAQREGMGVEEAARAERLAFLRRVAVSREAPVVAMGHHRDDQVETVLFRLFRGSHLRGLAGIRPSRPMGDGVRLVRPLLNCAREELRAYALDRSLTWREDPSNRDVGFSRNYIRHELLPSVRERLNPRADEAVVRAARAVGQADEFVSGAASRIVTPQGRQAVSLCLADLAEADQAVTSAAIHHGLEAIGAPMDRLGMDRIEELVRLAWAGEGQCDLAGGIRAWIERGSLWLGARAMWCVEEFPAMALPREGKRSLPGGLCVRVRQEELTERSAPEAIRDAQSLPAGGELLDADAICGSLTVRPRAEGDRFSPLGVGGSQTVSDLLSGAGVPPRLRPRALCVCDEEGIVYLWPVRIAQRVALGPETRRCCRLDIGPVEPGWPPGR